MKLSLCSYNPEAVHPGYNAPHDNLQMLAAEMGISGLAMIRGPEQMLILNLLKDHSTQDCPRGSLPICAVFQFIKLDTYFFRWKNMARLYGIKCKSIISGFCQRMRHNYVCILTRGIFICNNGTEVK